MKKILMTMALLLTMAVSYAQKPYEGLIFTSEIMDDYDRDMKNVGIEIMKAAFDAEDKGQSLDGVVERFNKAFGKYLKGMTANKNANSRTLSFLFREAKTEYIAEKTALKKKAADDMKNSLFVNNAILYLENSGVKRVDAIMDDVYIPIVLLLKFKADQAKGDEDALSYVVLESNIWFDRVAGHSLSLEASFAEVENYIELGKEAMKLDLLIKEKERMNRKK